MITGSVGAGKSTLSQAVAKALAKERKEMQWQHLEISRLVRERKLYKEWDDELGASIFDEELLDKEMEKELCASSSPGAVVDFHSASCFSQDIGDPIAVYVLRADNSVIFDRLTARGYPQRKVTENVECEIFGTVLEEAQEALRY